MSTRHDSPPPALAALPGACDDPGRGPVDPSVLDDVLDDAGQLPAHRSLVSGEHRDLVAALVVPATAAAATLLVDGLQAGDNGLRVVLAATGDDPLGDLRAARARLLDVDAVELVGVRLAIPAVPGTDPGRATSALLAELDSSVPAWITLPAGDATGAVLDVLVADGAENATIDVAGDPRSAAAVLRQAVDRDVSFRVCGAAGALGDTGPGGAPGLLNLLCATRAALNGAEADELAEVLAARDVAPLASALRRMSGADGAVVRAFLVAVEVPDAAETVAGLARLGLLPQS